LSGKYLFEVHDLTPIIKGGDLKEGAGRLPAHQQLYNQFRVLSRPLFVHTSTWMKEMSVDEKDKCG